MRKLITIRNDTKSDVVRANLVFPAARTVMIAMDTNISKFKEIKACSALRVIKYEDIVADTDVQPVLKINVRKSDVAAPEPVFKDETPVESFVYEVESAAEEEVMEGEVIEPSVPAEPEVDVVPVVVTPEEPIPDTSELEVAGAEKEEAEVTVSVSCPYCDFTSPAKMGTFHHVRTKHPDNYEEYKERLKQL